MFMWGFPVNSEGVLSVQGFYLVWLVWFGQAGWLSTKSPQVGVCLFPSHGAGPILGKVSVDLGRLLDFLSQQEGGWTQSPWLAPRPPARINVVSKEPQIQDLALRCSFSASTRGLSFYLLLLVNTLCLQF